jgi:Poly(ADP-ribose) polymerase catalytic domain
MSDKRYDKIEELIIRSYKNACIIFINEVENPDLLMKYENYKSELIEKRGVEIVKELQVFHGTHANTVPIICREGFDPSKNVTALHGRGTYFAKNADYSSSYMKSSDENQLSYMIISKMVLGKCTTVQGGIQEFDNYVDKIDDPSIFVCPHQYAAIPQFVVGFYKNTGKNINF